MSEPSVSAELKTVPLAETKPPQPEIKSEPASLATPASVPVPTSPPLPPSALAARAPAPTPSTAAVPTTIPPSALAPAPVKPPKVKKPSLGDKFSAYFTHFGDHLSIQEKINFARHLAMVIKAGLPVYEGLRILRKQQNSKTMNRVLDKLLIDVNNGRFLADSLDGFRTVFGEFFINIVRVGEASGTLAQNLVYLSEELRKSKELQGKVRSAMVYPIVILVMTISVTSFMAFYILPKLIPVLTGLRVELPPTTKALIATIDFLQNYGLETAIGAVVLFFSVRLLIKKVEAVRYLVHQMIFFMPVVSSLVICVNMVTFARVLAMLLRSGVKIVEAVNITGNTFSNLVYHRLISDANEEIKKGGQLATVLAHHTRFFPPLLSGMIQVGENTGNLEENLFYLAEYYGDEVDLKLKNLTTLLEPIMLLTMSIVVGFVAISIITPIYSMSSGVK